MLLLRNNNSLSRSSLKYRNNLTHTCPHHCSIELRNRANSCVFLNNPQPQPQVQGPGPVVLTTFGSTNTIARNPRAVKVCDDFNINTQSRDMARKCQLVDATTGGHLDRDLMNSTPLKSCLSQTVL